MSVSKLQSRLFLIFRILAVAASPAAHAGTAVIDAAFDVQFRILVTGLRQQSARAQEALQRKSLQRPCAPRHVARRAR